MYTSSLMVSESDSEDEEIVFNHSNGSAVRLAANGNGGGAEGKSERA